MLRILALLSTFITTIYAQDLRDGIVQVELHSRSGRVNVGRGVFYSGFGEFAVLRSIVEPAREKPYDYLLSFKTADGIALNDIKFSHCDKDLERGFCFYKANYVPYRKFELNGQKKELVLEDHSYYRKEKGMAQAKMEAHPDKTLAWATVKTNDGKIPGTVLFNKKGEPYGVVTPKTLRDSNLVIPLSSCNPNGAGSGGFHPIEQQNNNSLPKSEHARGENMARMVGDASKMSKDQIKAALESLFVPSDNKYSARSGLSRKMDNNSLRNNRKDEVLIQEAGRGDKARNEFFKKEAEALKARSETKGSEKELGTIEQKIAAKEKLLGAVDIQVETLAQSVAADSVKLDLDSKGMSAEEKQELIAKVAAKSHKLSKAKDKQKALGKEISELKEQLALAKANYEKLKKAADALSEQAKEAAKNNADAIQGANTYRGDLL